VVLEPDQLVRLPLDFLQAVVAYPAQVFGLFRHGWDVVVGVAGPADQVAAGADAAAFVVGGQVRVGLERVRGQLRGH
jgi:uncharacterized protein (DUF849 family)